MYSAVEYHIVSNMYPGAYCLCGPIYPIILRKIVVWLVYSSTRADVKSLQIFFR